MTDTLTHPQTPRDETPTAEPTVAQSTHELLRSALDIANGVESDAVLEFQSQKRYGGGSSYDMALVNLRQARELTRLLGEALRTLEG